MSRVDRYEYEDWNGFGFRIKKYREQIGLSKEKFAEMIARSENFVSELEKGKTSCSVHTIHQICKALKVSSDSLLYGEVGMDKDCTNKEILENIIDRCDKEELEILTDLIVATFPNLDKIKSKRKENNPNSKKDIN